MTQEQLTEITELCEKARGPIQPVYDYESMEWRVVDAPEAPSCSDIAVDDEAAWDRYHAESTTFEEQYVVADGMVQDFYNTSRTFIPAAIARIRELEEEVEKWQLRYEEVNKA